MLFAPCYRETSLDLLWLCIVEGPAQTLPDPPEVIDGWRVAIWY